METKTNTPAMPERLTPTDLLMAAQIASTPSATPKQDELVASRLEWIAEASRRYNSHAALVEAAGTVLESLSWEEKRSGTTYNGYEALRLALSAAEGGGR